jgi:hypothetical protein
MTRLAVNPSSSSRGLLDVVAPLHHLRREFVDGLLALLHPLNVQAHVREELVQVRDKS